MQSAGWDGLLTLVLSSILIVLTVGLSWLAALVWVLRVARRAGVHPRHGVDVIVVPGVRLFGDQPSPDYTCRLQRAQDLLVAGFSCPILLLGGQTGSNSESEARAGERFLRHAGVETWVIHLEERSQNTLENLRAAREMFYQHGWRYAALVSNRYHLARLRALATGLGFNYCLCAAEGRLMLPFRTLVNLCREAYFLHWYYVGKYWALLSGSETSLARIR
jgi:uncharacterized SAM-binding protein YcdF (DUF218 family)